MISCIGTSSIVFWQILCEFLWNEKKYGTVFEKEILMPKFEVMSKFPRWTTRSKNFRNFGKFVCFLSYKWKSFLYTSRCLVFQQVRLASFREVVYTSLVPTHLDFWNFALYSYHINAGIKISRWLRTLEKLYWALTIVVDL